MQPYFTCFTHIFSYMVKPLRSLPREQTTVSFVSTSSTLQGSGRETESSCRTQILIHVSYTRTISTWRDQQSKLTLFLTCQVCLLSSSFSFIISLNALLDTSERALYFADPPFAYWTFSDTISWTIQIGSTRTLLHTLFELVFYHLYMILIPPSAHTRVAAGSNLTCA